MNIGELFISLGIKGSDKTTNALKGVKDGLGETQSMAIETKAAILGAVYGFEQMMAASGRAGTALANFSALTGISNQTLQRYQYAARQVGVANDEVTGSFKSVQNAMTNMLLNKGAPEGYKFIANSVGLDSRRLKDTTYVMGQLQKAAGTMSKELFQFSAKSFGLSEGMVAAMQRNAFTAKTLSQAPVMSEQQIASLERANVAWSNLGAHVERAFANFNAKHGGSLVKDLTKMTDQVIKFADALLKLSERMQVFERIGMAFEGIGNTLKLLNDVMDKMNGKESDDNLLNGGSYRDPNVKGIGESPLGQFFKSLFTMAPTQGPLALDNPNMHKFHPAFSIAPNMKDFPAAIPTPPPITQNITHHGDAKDTKAVKDVHGAAAREVHKAYFTNPSVRRGS